MTADDKKNSARQTFPDDQGSCRLARADPEHTREMARSRWGAGLPQAWALCPLSPRRPDRLVGGEQAKVDLRCALIRSAAAPESSWSRRFFRCGRRRNPHKRTPSSAPLQRFRKRPDRVLPHRKTEPRARRNRRCPTLCDPRKSALDPSPAAPGRASSQARHWARRRSHLPVGAGHFRQRKGPRRDARLRCRRPSLAGMEWELPSKPSEFHTELLTEPDLIPAHFRRCHRGHPIPPIALLGSSLSVGPTQFR